MFCQLNQLGATVLVASPTFLIDAWTSGYCTPEGQLIDDIQQPARDEPMKRLASGVGMGGVGDCTVFFQPWDFARSLVGRCDCACPELR
jgi:hypothetical protein